MSRTLYLDFDDRTEDVRELMRQRPRETREFLDKYELSWIYHESALEGMVLTHSELRQALEPNPGMVDSSMVHAFTEVRNQRNAIDFNDHVSTEYQRWFEIQSVKLLSMFRLESRSRRVDKRDDFAPVAAVDAEIGDIHGDDAVLGMELAEAN